MTKQNIVSLYYSVFPCLFAFALWIGFGGGIEFNFSPAIAVFLLFYCASALRAAYYLGFLSLYAIYLYTGVFFVYSRLFFHLIGYESFLKIDWLIQYRFSDETGIIFLSCAFLSHYIIDFMLLRNRKKHQNVNRLKNYPTLQNTGFFLMLAAFPSIIYKLYLSFAYIKKNGYLALYTSAESIKYPFWTQGSGTFFFTGFLLILYSYPSKKMFKQAAVLFIIYSIMGSMSGVRSTVIVNTLAVIYCYIKLYNKRIPLKSILMLFVIFVGFSIFMGNFRGGEKTSLQSALLRHFFYGQGASIAVPLTIIEHGMELPFHYYPFMLSAFTHPILRFIYPNTGGGQNKFFVEKYNSMSETISYYQSPDMFFSGYGLGGSILAEMYDFGGFFGIIFWSAILAWIIKTVENKFTNINKNIPFMFFVITTVIYSPRNNFFGFIQAVQYLILIFLIINILKYVKPNISYHSNV
jgi:oligosaccharide repeat unit polymerase